MYTISRKCKKNAYKTFLPYSPKAHDKGVNWVGQVMNSQYTYGSKSWSQSLTWEVLSNKMYIIKYTFWKVLSLIIFNII